ncbi:hypothetical protein ACFVH6_29900 [Spirillospora sp. NPDC127200]
MDQPSERPVPPGIDEAARRWNASGGAQVSARSAGPSAARCWR